MRQRPVPSVNARAIHQAAEPRGEIVPGRPHPTQGDVEMRNAVLFAVLLLASLPAFSSDVKPSADAKAILAQQAEIRAEALAGKGRYKDIDPLARAFKEKLVPEIGIEPTTYALRMRRSTN